MGKSLAQMPFEQSDRVFQFWAFTVSMRLLLLRSVKTPTFNSRIDLVFQNVQVVNLPVLLPGLTVSMAEAQEAQRITDETGVLLEDGLHAYAVHCQGFHGYVIASLVLTVEDSGEFYDPSEVWPGRDETG